MCVPASPLLAPSRPPPPLPLPSPLAPRVFFNFNPASSFAVVRRGCGCPSPQRRPSSVSVRVRVLLVLVPCVFCCCCPQYQSALCVLGPFGPLRSEGQGPIPTCVLAGTCHPIRTLLVPILRACGLPPTPISSCPPHRPFPAPHVYIESSLPHNTQPHRHLYGATTRPTSHLRTQDRTQISKEDSCVWHFRHHLLIESLS